MPETTTTDPITAQRHFIARCIKNNLFVGKFGVTAEDFTDPGSRQLFELMMRLGRAITLEEMKEIVRLEDEQLQRANIN